MLAIGAAPYPVRHGNARRASARIRFATLAIPLAYSRPIRPGNASSVCPSAPASRARKVLQRRPNRGENEPRIRRLLPSGLALLRRVEIARTPPSLAAAHAPFRSPLSFHPLRRPAVGPRRVVARAAARGVDVLALTDHDELSGLAEARDGGGRGGNHLRLRGRAVGHLGRPDHSRRRPADRSGRRDPRGRSRRRSAPGERRAGRRIGDALADGRHSRARGKARSAT